MVRAVRLPLQTRIESAAVLARRGMLRPVRPDRLARAGLAFMRWGPTPATACIVNAITRPDQVWSADITYVPLPSGFMYLAATIDWFSRFVVSWRLSNTLDGAFCQEMLDESLSRGTPEVFNTDQGAQFTSAAFVNRLLDRAVAVSMDGRGRALDNVFIETELLPRLGTAFEEALALARSLSFARRDEFLVIAIGPQTLAFEKRVLDAVARESFEISIRHAMLFDGALPFRRHVSARYAGIIRCEHHGNAASHVQAQRMPAAGDVENHPHRAVVADLFDETVDLELKALPDGIKVLNPSLTIAEGQEEITLLLEADPDAELGFGYVMNQGRAGWQHKHVRHLIDLVYGGL